MSFLQQVRVNKIDESDDSRVVAIHKSTGTILLSHGAHFISKRKNKHHEWVELGRWLVPETYSRFPSQNVIEAYSCFILLASDANVSNVLFFDLNMHLCNVCQLGSITQAICADFDQNRKELVIGLKSHVLLSIVVRQVKESGNELMFHTIPRKYTQFSRTFLRTPSQIATQDIMSAFLVLSNNGNVICFETGTFDTLWFIKSVYFLDMPLYIWADKFGPFFVIKFRIRLGSSEKVRQKKTPKINHLSYDADDNVLKDYLELWSPPDTAAGLHDSVFTRVALPLGHLPTCAEEVVCVLGVNIETIGASGALHGGDPHIMPLHCLITVCLDNRHVLVWQPMVHLLTLEKTVRLSADIILSGAVGSLHPPPDSEIDREQADYHSGKGICTYLGFGAINNLSNSSAADAPISILISNLNDSLDLLLYFSKQSDNICKTANLQQK